MVADCESVLFVVCSMTPTPPASPICNQDGAPGHTNSSWYGITCSEGEVVAISLAELGSGFKGILHSSLGDMTSLTRLDLSGNKLEESIPAEISKLTNLVSLQLNNNAFTGEVLSSVQSLKQLQVLDLSYNSFTGPLYTYLNDLTNLRSLRLTQNLLVGPIPSDINKLSYLQALNLGELLLNGPIPPTIGLLSLLTHLDLNSSHVSSTIPAEIGMLSKLESLIISDNNINGTIPGEFESLHKLSELFLSHNQLAGVVPPELGSLSQIVNFDVAFNYFTGTIPKELGKLHAVQNFDMTYNGLTGPIPSTLCELTLPSPLKVITGNSLSCIASCYSSTFLTLDDPKTMALQECAFEPTVDEEALCNLAYGSNSLSLEMIGWDCISKTEPYDRPICHVEGTWEGLRCENGIVVSIDIPWRGFSIRDGLPDSLGHMTMLSYLDMRHNMLNGSLPSTLGQLSNVVHFDLTASSIEGTIPPSFGSMSKVTSLLLGENMLQGTIPVAIEKLENLMVLALDSNNITGSVPAFLGNMSNLNELLLQTNQFTGDLYEELCPLNTLNVFMVATNNSIRCSDKCFQSSGRSMEPSAFSSLRKITDVFLLDVCVDPSSQPTSEPTGLPSSIPTTPMPTFQPSVSYMPTNPSSSPTTVFEGIDIWEELNRYVPTPAEGTNYVSFDYILDESTSFNSTTQILRWKSFILTYVESAFSLLYYKIEVFSVSFSGPYSDRRVPRHMDVREEYSVNQLKFTCDDSQVADSIVKNLVYKRAEPVVCNGIGQQMDVYWTSDVNQNLCVSEYDCFTIEEPFCYSYSSVQVVPSVTCSSQQHKVASRVIIYMEEVAAKTVPQIKDIDVLPSSTEVRVRVDVAIPSGLFLGRVYCAAFTEASILTSAQEVANHENTVFFSLNSTTSNRTLNDQELIIDGLIPVVNYSVYCFGEDLEVDIDGGSTLTEVLNSRVDFTTACCRPITTTFPSSVIITLTSTSFSADTYELDQFLFSFEIPHLPTETSGTLVIVPTFRNEIDVITNAVVASPAIFNVSSSSARKYSFVIASSTVGIYSVTLSLSGNEAFKYEASPVPFEVVNEAPTPPVLSEGLFNRAGKLFLYFDTPTDRGKSVYPSISSALFKCSLLFNFIESSSSRCLWINSTVVEVRISSGTSGSLLSPGGIVVLVGGVVRSYYCLDSSSASCDSNSYSASNSIITSAMASVRPPTVIISTLSEIDMCSSIVVDASGSTGSGGRLWHDFKWVVLETTNSTDTRKSAAAAEIENYLNSLGVTSLSKKIEVVVAHEAESSYTIGLYLSNFLQPADFSYGVVTVKILFSESRVTPASVAILGNTVRSFDVSDRFAISALGTWAGVASCTGDVIEYPSYTVFYEWSLYLNLVYQNVKSVAKSPKRFLLDPYSLTVGQSYVLEVTVHIITPVINGTQFTLTDRTRADLYVNPGRVYAVITGGKQRSVSSSKAVAFDASNSYDEAEGSFVVVKSVIFSWTCQVVYPQSSYGSSCGYAANNAVSSANNMSSDILKIPGQSMEAQKIYEYSVIVQAKSHKLDSGEYRSAVYSVFIEVQDATSELSVDISSSFEKFNWNYPVQVDGTVSGATGLNSEFASWTIDEDGVMDALFAEGVVLTPVERNFTQVEVDGDGISFPIQIAAYALTPGKSYTFRLSVVTSDQILFSTLTITANDPPTSGVLIVDPAAADADAWFSLKATYWTDDAEDYPLQYAFTYKQYSGSASVLPLQLISEVIFVDTFLPPGLSAYNYEVECLVEVSDIYLAAANTTAQVQVRPSAVTSNLDYSQVYAVLLESLVISNDVKNYNQILQDIQFYASSVLVANCTAAPNCSALNRQECTYTAHTCGHCLDGFVSSTSSVSNTVCVTEAEAATALESRALDEKTCQSALPDLECSGHGYCTSSGNVEDEVCLESNPYCSPMCSCDENYFGLDCSLDAYSANYLDLSVRTIVDGLLAIHESEDDAVYRYNLVVDTLLEIKPSFVINNETEFMYVELIKLTSQELLDNAVAFYISTSQINNMITIVSRAIEAGSSFSPSSHVELYEALDNAITGQLNNIADGQYPVRLDTDNVQIFIQADTISSTVNATYKPPSTPDKKFYNESSSSITFPSSGLSTCGNFEKYARIVVGETKASALSNSSNSSIGSNFLKIGAYTTNLTNAVAVASNAAYNTSSEATYTIVLQLTGEYNFNTNVSLPGCVVYDSTTSTFLDCPCTLSAKSPTNVTFECVDQEYICPSYSTESSTAKSLRSNYVPPGRLYQPSKMAAKSWQRRRLDFDYSGTEDDGYGNDYSAGDVGVLVTALGEESNVFTSFDFQDSLGSLIVLAVIFGLLIWGLIYFIRWDETDRNALIYANEKSPVIMTCNAKYMTLPPLDHFVLNQQKSFEKIHQKRVATEETEHDEGVKVENEKLSPNDNEQSLLDSPSRVNSSQFLNIESKMQSAGFYRSLKRQRSVQSSADNTAPHTPKSKERGRKENFVRRLSSSKTLTKVTKFVDGLMPSADIFSTHSTFSRFLSAVYNEHDWINMFAYGSLRKSRTIRYLKVVSDTLIVLFFDSVFYGVLFPDDSTTCAIYETEDECLVEESYYKADETLCEWSDDVGCSLRPPPSSFIFYAIVSLLLTFFIVIPSLGAEYLLMEYCTCRPNMEDLGLINEKWFRSNRYRSSAQSTAVQAISAMYDNELIEESGIRKPYFEMSAVHNEKVKDDNHSVSSCNSGMSDGNNSGVDLSLLSTEAHGLSPTTSEKNIDCENDSNYNMYTNAPGNQEAPPTDDSSVYQSASAIAMLSYDENHMGMLRYYDRGTVDEEFNYVLSEARKCLEYQCNHMALPWQLMSQASSTKSDGINDEFSKESFVTNILFNQLGLYPDGLSAPAGMWRKFMKNDPASRLKRKLSRSRQESNRIIKELSLMDDILEIQEKDTALLQYFILEQFSAVKRYALKKHFLQYETQPRLIGFWKWLFVWFILVCFWLFLMAYLVFWAASLGDKTTIAFSIQFGLFLIQDLFVNQIIQIYIIHVLTIELLRPQLKTIKHVLNQVMSSKAGKNDVVSRRKKYGVTDIVQHISSSCRAARSPSLINLPSARLLINVDDRDMLLCRNVRRQQIGFWSYLLVGIVAVLAFSNDTVTTLILELIIPTVWCLFLLLNAIVIELDYVILVSFYFGFALCCMFYMFIYRPSKRFIRKCPEQITPARHNLFQHRRTTSWIKTVKERHREKVNLSMRKCRRNQMTSTGIGIVCATLNFAVQKCYLCVQSGLINVILWFGGIWNRFIVTEKITATESAIWKDMNKSLHENTEVSTAIQDEIWSRERVSVGVVVPDEIAYLKVAKNLGIWEKCTSDDIQLPSSLRKSDDDCTTSTESSGVHIVMKPEELEEEGGDNEEIEVVEIYPGGDDVLPNSGFNLMKENELHPGKGY